MNGYCPECNSLFIIMHEYVTDLYCASCGYEGAMMPSDSEQKHEFVLIEVTL